MQTDVPTPVCKICSKTDSHNDPWNKIRDTGAETLNAASKTRGDNLIFQSGDLLHHSCRRDYSNKKALASLSRLPPTAPPTPKKTRQNHASFDFRKNCFLCGECLSKKDDYVSVMCKDREVDNSISQTIKDRNFDKWASCHHATIFARRMQSTTRFAIRTFEQERTSR